MYGYHNNARINHVFHNEYTRNNSGNLQRGADCLSEGYIWEVSWLHNFDQRHKCFMNKQAALVFMSKLRNKGAAGAICLNMWSGD